MESMMPGDGIDGMTLNLMAGALTIKLLRQLQWSAPNYYIHTFDQNLSD